MFDMIGATVGSHLVLVTTNSYIRRDGALVMGRGAAKQLANLYPDVPYEFGRRVGCSLAQYGLFWMGQTAMRPALGAFQVKWHFKEQANLDLILDSSRMLKDVAQKCADSRIDMNYPGIGNGRLSYDIVDPLLQDLPDNVHIWTFH
jgi:hypothetical protein